MLNDDLSTVLTISNHSFFFLAKAEPELVSAIRRRI